MQNSEDYRCEKLAKLYSVVSLMGGRDGRKMGKLSGIIFQEK
jgi:hypothetical protein